MSVALRKELLEIVRSHRLTILGTVLLLFGLLSPLLARFTPNIVRMLPGGESLAALVPEPSVGDAVGQYVKNTTQFGVILALLLAMGMVAQEKERGTAALLLVKPLSRTGFLVAKFTALAVTFALSLSAAGAGAYLYTAFLFAPLSAGPWIALNALLFLFLLVYVAVTLLCSTLARSTLIAGGLAFGAVVLLGGLAAIPRLGDYLPSRLTSCGATLALGGDCSWRPAAAVSLGLIALALAAACLAFERQEL
ncbi:MAG: ABC transporter permease [Chloroflexia bacterium]